MPPVHKNKTFELIEANKVIETISEGYEVIACNLATLQMTSCDDLKIGGLRSNIANEAVVFYKKVIVDE